MISTAMAKAAYSRSHTMTSTTTRSINGFRTCVQAAIDKAFTPFDQQDPATWPKSEYALSGAHWLVWFEQPCLLKWNGAAFCDDDCNYYKAVSYADPADLRPTQGGETP